MTVQKIVIMNIQNGKEYQNYNPRTFYSYRDINDYIYNNITPDSGITILFLVYVEETDNIFFKGKLVYTKKFYNYYPKIIERHILIHIRFRWLYDESIGLKKANKALKLLEIPFELNK